MAIQVTVMDADLPPQVRKQVIEGLLTSIAQACGMEKPSPAWWVTFQVVDEGSWGSRGSVLSILDLLQTGVFTPERAQAVRAALT